MNARQLQECSTLKTELEGWSRMTPRLASERSQDPRELERSSNSALTILSRLDALLEELGDDSEATRWREHLRFDREQVKQGVRSILEIVLAKAERDTRIVMEKSLSEAATFSRIVLEQSQRFDSLRAAAESAGGPFPGVKIKLSPEVRKALSILARDRV